MRENERRCAAAEPAELVGVLRQEPAICQGVSGAVGTAGGHASRAEWQHRETSQGEGREMDAFGDEEGDGDGFRSVGRELGPAGGV